MSEFKTLFSLNDNLLLTNSNSKEQHLDNEVTRVPESMLRVLHQETRDVFFWIMLPLGIIAVIGNLCAIISILERRCKYLQKFCVISLSLSDALTSIIFAVNNLESFSHDLLVWTLGQFMCYFIPMAQVMGTLASALALLIIAVDRYHNVIYALSKRWDPSLFKCAICTLILWGICTALSYPMYRFFYFYPILIEYQNSTKYDSSFLCVSLSRDEMALFYTTIATIIFGPIFILFIWFYFKIAVLIWKHRKPVGHSVTQQELSSISKSDQCPLKSIIKGKKNLQVERKIRTFKIVILLMMSFLLLRAPYFLINVVKFQMEKTETYVLWNWQYSFICMIMLSCCLNPLLYTFLNATIAASKTLVDFFQKICCCASEFEDMHRENPFVIDANPKAVQFQN